MGEYYELTKPGIVYGNALTTAAGFLFASRTSVDVPLFLATILGTSLTIACACVINNYIDRGLDARMERTKLRALASGRIPALRALTFAAVLGFCGITLLLLCTNLLSVSILLAGFFSYIVVYSIAKRRSVYFTYAGAVAGAVPPLVGYTTVTHAFDASALVLFLIMCFWQMAHFYSIAMYRQDEYTAAGIPVLPQKMGDRRTQIEIEVFVVAFAIAAFMLSIVARVGYVYTLMMSLVVVVWLAFGGSGFFAHDLRRWARRMFLASLAVIALFSCALSVNAFW